MKQLKSIILLMMVALLPMPALAEEGGDEKINIPEIVLEHLADSYEWHIASYQGKHLSIPLPIIIRSENTGEWHFCTAHSLPPEYHPECASNMDCGGSTDHRLPQLCPLV